METQRTADNHIRLPIIVRSSKRLSILIGSPFVLFIGSAVSGCNFPRVPMAQDFIKQILIKAAEALKGGSYGERLLAEYAELLCGKSHSSLLKTTKFEEFLWQIKTATERESLNDLLYSVYVCHEGEYGPNQSAISWLLNKRVCSACFTTNFDNSIELAYNLAFQKELSICNHPNYPSNLLDLKDYPTLLKLHGDAKARNCVATIPDMSDAKRLASHKMLRDLLSNQAVLVLGYSGTGDVDISPHLSSAEEATFAWGEKDEKSPIPPFAKCRVLCDLKSTDPSKNLLLGLAELYGWQWQSNGRCHDWEQSLNNWFYNIDRKALAKIILLTLFIQTGWPVVHASRFAPVPVASDHPLIDEGIVCLQVSAYGPAERAFNRALSSGNLSPSQYITSKVYLGFTQWRRGNLDQALNTLWYFYDISIKPHRKEEYVEIGNGLRIYLEVARDRMQIMRSLSNRREFYRSKNLDDVVDRLKSLPTIDFKGDILAQTVILHICYLTGETVSIKEIKGLFDESYDAMIWGTAEAVGRLFVCVSFRQGLIALMKVDRKLAQRRQWYTIRKSVAAILHAFLGCRFPIILNMIDGPIFAKITSWWRCWRYKRNLESWNEKFRKGVTDIV